MIFCSIYSLSLLINDIQQQALSKYLMNELIVDMGYYSVLSTDEVQLLLLIDFTVCIPMFFEV